MTWARTSRIVFDLLAVGLFVVGTIVGLYDEQARVHGGDQATITEQIRAINAASGWLIFYLYLTVWLALGFLGLHLFLPPLAGAVVSAWRGGR